jgi:acetyl-CoA carboxylase carboxyl transferase subunit alpha
MLQYATYSVISPEGCASILWKTSERGRCGRSAGPDRAPPEGHRPDRQDRQRTAGRRTAIRNRWPRCSSALADSLRQFHGMKTKDLLEARHEKLMSYGKFKETTPQE